MHASVRHLDVLYDKLTLTDKVAHAYCLGKRTGRGRDGDGAHRRRPDSHEEFEASPHMYSNINSTSPLKHDFPDAGRLDPAGPKRNQGLVVTPFTLAGAMAPVTMAGAVAQSLAEGLVRDRAGAGRSGPACELRDRHVHQQCRHEIGRAGVRDAGIHARDADDGATGAVLWSCQCGPPACVRQTSPTDRRCGKPRTACGRRCSRGRTWSITPPAGWKAG